MIQIKKTTLQNILIIGLIVIVGIIGVVLANNKKDVPEFSSSEAVTIVDGKQIIDITAKGGYTPRVIEAKANQETILRISTKNTFDCSSALVIPSLGVNKNLPVTGKTDIVIAAQAPGSEIDGTCSMGMYGFKIKFV